MAAWLRRYRYLYPSAAISFLFLAACAGPGAGPAAPAAPSLLAPAPEAPTAPTAVGGSFFGTFVDDEQGSGPDEVGRLDLRIRDVEGFLVCEPDGDRFACVGSLGILTKKPPLDEGTFVSVELKNSGITGQTIADGSRVLLFPEFGGVTSRCPAREPDDHLRLFDINRNELAKVHVFLPNALVELCQAF
jgi:hypothetical protein